MNVDITSLCVAKRACYHFNGPLASGYECNAHRLPVDIDTEKPPKLPSLCLYYVCSKIVRIGFTVNKACKEWEQVQLTANFLKAKAKTNRQ